MKKAHLIFSLVLFALLVEFFIVLHPIAIFDTDDWNFIYMPRIPVPIIGKWNPIKVFPEFFMPLVSYIGAYTVYPLTGKYCLSLSIANGLFICFIITVYFTEFYLLIQKKYKLSTVKSLLISVVFIGMHFCAVAHGRKNNVFLFYAYDMTCVYHYILSTLLNASLVMHLMRIGGLEAWKTLAKKNKIHLALWIYFAIFSSLYSSVVLGAYLGVELLHTLYKEVKGKSFNVKSYWTKNRPPLIVILVWFCSFIIEKTGGRAACFATGIPHNILSSGKRMVFWFGHFNIIFVVIGAAVIILRIFFLKREYLVEDAKIALALCLTTIYIILLSAVVNYTYVERTDAILPVAFWALFMLMMFVGKMSEKIKYGNTILSLMAAVSVIGTVYYSNTYEEINYEKLPYENCEAFVDDVINQFKEAESQGETEIELVLPEFNTDDNWPIADYASGSFSESLYFHGVTDQKIDVEKMVFTKRKNKEFGIN